jgi:hypothetical protein
LWKRCWNIFYLFFFGKIFIFCFYASTTSQRVGLVPARLLEPLQADVALLVRRGLVKLVGDQCEPMVERAFVDVGQIEFRLSKLCEKQKKMYDKFIIFMAD